MKNSGSALSKHDDPRRVRRRGILRLELADEEHEVREHRQVQQVDRGVVDRDPGDAGLVADLERLVLGGHEILLEAADANTLISPGHRHFPVRPSLPTY